MLPQPVAAADGGAMGGGGSGSFGRGMRPAGEPTPGEGRLSVGDCLRGAPRGGGGSDAEPSPRLDPRLEAVEPREKGGGARGGSAVLERLSRGLAPGPPLAASSRGRTERSPDP